LLDHIVTHQVRPGDSRLRVNDASFAIEAEHSIHRSRVEQPRILRELLASHRVTRAGDAHAVASQAQSLHGRSHIIHRAGNDATEHAGGIEVRMFVVADLARKRGFSIQQLDTSLR
jgi:hypothetical protein